MFRRQPVQKSPARQDYASIASHATRGRWAQVHVRRKLDALAPVLGIATSPDGRLLAVRTPSSAMVWESARACSYY